jgi:hypothetical protein
MTFDASTMPPMQVDKLYGRQMQGRNATHRWIDSYTVTQRAATSAVHPEAAPAVRAAAAGLAAPWPMQSKRLPFVTPPHCPRP